MSSAVLLGAGLVCVTIGIVSLSGSRPLGWVLLLLGIVLLLASLRGRGREMRHRG